MRSSVLATVIVLSGVFAPASAQEAVRIGTSSVGSTFYILSVGAAELLGRHAGINATVEPLGGSGPNVFGLGDGTIEMSMLNSFTAQAGYMGAPPYSDPTDITLLFQGQPTYRFVLVRPGAGISMPEDLHGKTIIGQRRALPEIGLVMNAVVEAFDLDPGRINIVETQTTPEALEAISVGSVDGLIMPAGRAEQSVMEAMQHGHLEFLPMDAEAAARLLEHLPSAFYSDVIEAGTFPGQTADVHVVGMNTYFVAHANLDEDTAYRATRAILKNNEEFSSFHAGGRYYTLENTVGVPAAIPFHPGAVRYLREAGAWTDEMEARQAEMAR